MTSVIGHIMRSFSPSRIGRRGFAGILIFLLNFIIGWGGAAFCAAMAAMDSGRAKTWGACGLIVYGISWGLLFLGILLAGKPVITAFKQRIPQIFKACRRLKAIKARRA